MTPAQPSTPSTAVRPRHRIDKPSTIVGAVAAAAVAAPLVTGLLVIVNQPIPVPGVPTAPLAVTWGVLACRALLDLAMTAALGLGLVPLMFDEAERAAASRVIGRAYLSSTLAAVVWCVCALSCLVLQAVELDPVTSNFASTLVTFVFEIGGAQALATNGTLALVALVVALMGVRNGGLLPARLLVAASAISVLPLVASGHAGESDARWHDLAMVALELHVFAALVWAGGLGAMVWLLAAQRALLARALPRFSRLAGACLGVVALSGLVSGLVELAGAPLPMLTSLFGTPYGYMLLGKLGCLAVLAVLGAHIRFRLLPVIERARPAGFALWAGVELAVMGAAFGLAVALTRSGL